MSHGNMMECPHCGARISKTATTCPKCGGKIKKPLFKKWWFWVLVVLFIAGAANRGNNSQSDNNYAISRQNGQNNTPSGQTSGDNASTANQGSAGSTTNQGSAGSGDQAGQATNPGSTGTGNGEDTNAQTASSFVKKDIYHVGDTLMDGKTQIIYLASGDYQEENSFLQPPAGKKYIFFKLAVVNTSTKTDTSISAYSFDCYADGYACDLHYSGDNSLSASLSAGRSTSGYVYFTVPEDAATIEMEYSPGLFSKEKIKFAFDGNSDSGLPVPTNPNPTEGALQIGDTATSNKLNITYLNCFTDSFDNIFLSPRAGYHYVTAELEFENLSNSDFSVSSLLIECYADGAACEGVYLLRDDNLSATISPGRKAKGTVTFEVPDDATVIEVEYPTSFWISNRVVFNATGY